MSAPRTNDSPLRLEPVQGPEVRAVEVESGQSLRIGRGRDADFILNDEAVSRRHAAITSIHGRWMLTDLGSRHGTTLNAIALQPNHPALLANRDLLRIGPWTLRIAIGSDDSERMSTTEDTAASDQRIEHIPQRDANRFAQHQLALLIDGAAQLATQITEDDLATALLKLVLAGTGFHHAALLRARPDSDVEVIAYRKRDAQTGRAGATDSLPEASFSRSLIRAASEGSTVRLSTTDARMLSVSIAELGITSALCTPIYLGQAIAAYLYLDARGRERDIEESAAGYCQALARMCGLALANIKRIDLEKRGARIETELHAAREAQRLIFPPADGEVGGVRYAVQTLPGHFLAGDLFDIMPLHDGTVALCIGDVTGEGVGAAVIMAATQAHLHSALQKYDDLAEVVSHVNRYIAHRSPSNRFVTLWVGRLDPRTGVLRYVDAGHAHWIRFRPGAAPLIESPDRATGIPIGIEADFHYEHEQMTLDPKERLILYTDGVIEQTNAAGERFRRSRILPALATSDSAQEDVAAIVNAVQKFAGKVSQADDVTAASIALV